MSSSSSSSPSVSQEEADSKILQDLTTLAEKLNALETLLQQHRSGELPVHQASELLSVIGFLEACAPRMIELVEAAAQGALSEAVLIQCLDMNDRLTKALSDLDAVTLPEAATATSTTTSSPGADFDLVLRENVVGTAAAASATTSTADDDRKPSIKPTSSDDEFDSFFSERTGSSNL